LALALVVLVVSLKLQDEVHGIGIGGSCRFFEITR
jgi:hypothetical protein